MPATLEREMLNAKDLDRLKPLLKDLITRIEKIGEQVAELRKVSGLGRSFWRQNGVESSTQDEFAKLHIAFSRIHPIADDVDRHVSQLVEHAGLDELDRWDLLLKLVEIETAISVTQHRLKSHH